MHDKRPVNLALGTIQFPLPAIVSLLHRISGFALFGLVPLVLWAWQQSLASPEAFAALGDSVLFKLALIITLAGTVYHTLAGFRHLVADAGVGESLPAARASAIVTLGLSAVLVVALGVWIWA
ncbi:MAG: succinate dehydrogenase, cytochrome b556 subunit [Gammaproteobacteria bacterium]